jgi:predicted NBD/HSP70 family sugar kinase
MTIALENDAQCFAFAEATFGAGKGHSVVVGITLGTGVGGGIVINGQLYRGAHGHGGEIGHMLLRPGQPPYHTDDLRGDVEQFISGSAMKHRCQEAKKPEDYLEGEVCSFLRPDVFREVAWMCVSLSALLDPSIFILGGSTGHALKPHLPTIMKEWKQWSLPNTTEPLFTTAMLQDAGVRGAAALALAQ